MMRTDNIDKQVWARRKWGYTLAVVLWMAVIFAFSAQNAELSGEVSDGIVDHVIDWFFPQYANSTDADQLLIHNRLAFAVRKTAHVTEYTVLGMLIFLAADAWMRAKQKLQVQGTKAEKQKLQVQGTKAEKQQKWQNRSFRAAGISCGISILYAASDEYHQLFVPGRAGRITDVAIDSIGVFLGTGILFLLSCWKDAKKKQMAAQRD